MKKIITMLSIVVGLCLFSVHPTYASQEIIISKSLQQLIYWDNETQQIFLACPVSTGINPEDTPVGIFSTSNVYPQWHELYYNQWAYGAIRVYDHILLHSVPYLAKDINTLDWNEQLKLGTPASHGCIRMSTENIQFLVQTVPRKTRVVILP